MAQYLIYFNQQWVGDHPAEWFQERGPLARAAVDEIIAAGEYVFAGGLEEDLDLAFSADATSGEVLLTDGPFAETKEWLGGLTIVDVPDVETARKWAGKIAVACGWPQEVRPFKPWSSPRSEPAEASRAGGTEYLIYFNQQWVGDHPEEWFQERGHESRAVVEEIIAAGHYSFAGGLEEDLDLAFSADATSGEVLFSDGPFAETKEWLGGFTVVDVPDVETARMWTGKIAVACGWPQEARPFGRMREG
ncbi:YciI family protein [Nocardioides caricicola]|uniref:YciI family protein n=1 Tax=Nocardioides caricicola TaxID=634770 RepID=A0ABW0MVQ1_9ACTN